MPAKWMIPHLRKAEELRKQARAAALAGDLAEAERLRREMDRIFETLETIAAGLAGNGAPAELTTVPRPAPEG